MLLKRSAPFISREFFNEYLPTSRIYNEFFGAMDLNSSMVQHFKYKLEHLLRVEDRVSMAFSLEARVPYLDYRIIEFMLRISDKLKIKAGETKYLQKQALEHYTIKEIIDRKDKVGFDTPLDEWMQNEKWKKLYRESFVELRSNNKGIFADDESQIKTSENKWKIIQASLWDSNSVT